MKKSQNTIKWYFCDMNENISYSFNVQTVYCVVIITMGNAQLEKGLSRSVQIDVMWQGAQWNNIT